MSGLAKYNPFEVAMELSKCNTTELCLVSETPALSVLKKENGPEKVLALLVTWIVDINEYFNIQNKMKPKQMKESALFLMQDFYYFKIADINLIFNNAKKGRYGNLYGSLDGSKIYSWFEEHDKERASACYQEKLRAHDEIKERRF